MENLKEIKLTLKPCKSWASRAGQWLAADVDTRLSSDDIRSQMRDGAALFTIQKGPQCVGAFLLRVDDSASGPVGVVVAGAGIVAGVSLMQLVMPKIESLFVGCNSVRIHSSRAGMARKLTRHGYAPIEIVYEKKLNARGG